MHGVAQIRREIRSSFESFAPELPPGTLERRGWRRVWPVARAMFLRLTPARRALFILSLVLLVSSLAVSGGAGALVATNRLLLCAACLLILLAMELAGRVALKRDLELAREIQAWLLPQRPPEIPGLDIAFGMRPANTVAGDYYDVLPLPGPDASGSVLLVVADVAGKGIPSGLLMAGFQSCLHTLLEAPPGLRELVEGLQRFCCGVSHTGRRFTSAFLALYDSGARALAYVNAGHNPPLLRRATGDILQLDAGGVPFGMFAGARYDTGRIGVEPGDYLLMYTDGVVEAVNDAGDEYGLDRLRRLLGEANGAAADLRQSIFASLDAFTGKAPQHDDMTCLIVRVQPQ